MILITGATGFLGSNLTKKLLKDDYNVRVLCRDVSKAKKFLPKADVIKGDVTDRDSLKLAAKDAKKIIHLAGMVSYTISPSELFRINVHGTENVLEASKNADKFLFSSSVATMGEIKGVADESYKGEPANVYGKSKLDAESVVLGSSIKNACLRIAPIYGAGSLIWKRVIRMIEKGFPVPNIENMMHVVHVSDVVQAFEKGLKKGSGIYIIADEKPIKMTEFTGLIAAGLRKKQKVWPSWLVHFLASLTGKKKELDAFIINRNYDISKAKRELGFQPKKDLKKEIKKMVDWYLENKELNT